MRLDVLLLRHRDDALGELLVRLEDDLARRRIDDVGRRERAFALGVDELDRLDAGLLQRLDLIVRGSSCPACSAAPMPGIGNSARGAAADQRVGHLPQRSVPPFSAQLVDRVERAQDLVGAAQAERAQEHRRQELALAVDADVEQVLRVVLELHPRAAVRDDLRDVERLVFRVEERARRPVQLADDDALGAVDDERAVVAHQRDVAEVDLLLLDVADRLDARSRGPCSRRRAGS